jgi:DNA-binding response OmpR family regulator
MKIGLVEDNPAVGEYMSTLLEMAGHTVEIYTQGSSLLEVLFTEVGVRSPLPYDLVIVDLLLPGMLSGLATIQSIQQRLSPERLPVLIVTAVGPKPLEEVATKLPTVPVLRKPFQRRALLELIEEVKRTGDKEG